MTAIHFNGWVISAEPLLLIGLGVVVTMVYDELLQNANAGVRPRDIVLWAALFGICLAVAMRAGDPGWDFPAFYVAGRVPVRLLYNVSVFHDTAKNVLPPSVWIVPPYVRPAAFALPLKIIGAMPYQTAKWIWTTASALINGAAAILLCRRFQCPGPVLTACAAFFPATVAVMNGQDATWFLFLLAVAYISLLDGKDTLAGVCLGVCTCKFHLLLFVPFLLIFHKRWRALASLTIVGALLAILSVSLAPLSEYLYVLRHVPELTVAYIPAGTAMLVTIPGIRGMLVIIREPQLYIPIALIGGLTLIYVMSKTDMRVGFALAIAGSIVLAYHSGDYDYSLALIPMLAFWPAGNDWIRRGFLAFLVFPPAWRPWHGVVAEVALIALVVFQISAHKSEALETPFVAKSRT